MGKKPAKRARFPSSFAAPGQENAYIHPHRAPSAHIARQNLSHAIPVICDGSPSRILSVRRISFGITTRPNSSILRTIPVARTNAASFFPLSWLP